MKRLLPALLSLAVFLLSATEVRSADVQQGWDAYSKGWDAYSEGDFVTALRIWEPLAEQGLADAQNGLGVMYQHGEGVPENHKTAVKWFRLAALQGDAQAQVNLGSMYGEGQGVPLDYKTAVKWYRLAAEQGNADAQWYLGESNFRGLGVPLNYKTAAKWYRLAAEQGDADAQFSYGAMYHLGFGFPQDYKVALNWYELAAKQGNAKAQFRLGAMYHRGLGVPQSDKVAVKWYQLAAKQGNAVAQSRLKDLQFTIAEQNSSPAVTIGEQKQSARVEVDPSDLIVKQFPGKDAREIARLRQNEEFTISYINDDDWAHIAFSNDRHGFINIADLTPDTQQYFAEAKAKRDRKVVEDKAVEQEPSITITAGTSQTLMPKTKFGLTAVPSTQFGDYYALVIGNDDYTHLKNLKNAVQDAKDISAVLKSMYDFDVQILLNATRSKILNALENLRDELTSDSNLLIYYAGHGYVDKVTKVGYWQPVDANEIYKSNWIPNSDVTNEIKAMRAKHIMVIADSCYSGTLARSSPKRRPIAKDSVLYKRLAQKASRTALVSGGYEEVMDGGGGKNSVFAKALLDVLRNNQSVMDGAEIFERLRRPVVLASKQTPEYSDIKFAGHDGGHFLLVRKDATTVQPSVSEGADPLEKIERKCSELDFAKGTEKHDDCVIKLMKLYK